MFEFKTNKDIISFLDHSNKLINGLDSLKDILWKVNREDKVAQLIEEVRRLEVELMNNKYVNDNIESLVDKVDVYQDLINLMNEPTPAKFYRTLEKYK